MIAAAVDCILGDGSGLTFKLQPILQALGATVLICALCIGFAFIASVPERGDWGGCARRPACRGGRWGMLVGCMSVCPGAAVVVSLRVSACKKKCTPLVPLTHASCIIGQ